MVKYAIGPDASSIRLVLHYIKFEDNLSKYCSAPSVQANARSCAICRVCSYSYSQANIFRFENYRLTNKVFWTVFW
jgi:hypothetical protein